MLFDLKRKLLYFVPMFMGGDSGDSGDGGAAAREVQRQAMIRAGVAAINRSFDGGAKPTGLATSFAPGTTYYKADGSIWQPDVSGGFGGGADLSGIAAPADGQFESAGPLYTGIERSGGFGDDYYKGIADLYKQHYAPLIDEQYQTARRTLPYQFATTDNSEYQRRAGELERDYQRQLVDNSSAAEDFSNQRRQAVESQRQNLVSQVTAGADPGTAATLAAGAVKSLSAQPTFSALGDLFAKYTGNAANYVQSQQGQGPGQQYTPINFNRGAGAVTNVN